MCVTVVALVCCGSRTHYIYRNHTPRLYYFPAMSSSSLQLARRGAFRIAASVVRRPRVAATARAPAAGGQLSSFTSTASSSLAARTSAASRFSAAKLAQRTPASTAEPRLCPPSAAAAFRGFSTETSASESAAAASPNTESHEFQAETKQLLDIVINSLYTDKDVFLRELVSNAADALEKVRYFQTTEGGADTLLEKDAPLEIRISADAAANTITIEDTGIGLTREQMMENLGTIARSGSKAFLADVQGTAASSDVDIIGKFGVGFYAAFMVAKRIQVFSKSATSAAGDPGHVWTSEGVGSYDIAPLDADGPEGDATPARGTRIVLELRDDAAEFVQVERLRSVLRQYSNFVPVPIQLAGERVNTVQAIWASTPSDVSDDEYGEFYRYIANAFDDPRYRLHFRADVPIDMKALFFVPQMHGEKYGMGREEGGVALYSRKVLIDNKAEGILPDWLRFVKGVVDSEDLPLNISRESMQDSALVQKIGTVLTRRFLRFLEENARKDAKAYDEFFQEFGHFLKEGAVTDFDRRADVAKLLRFETSSRGADDDDVLSSFDDYISRCPADQEKIYYLCAPSRELALASPYYENFKRHKTEVLFLYTPIDEFVMGNLGAYDGRQLVSAETGGLDLAKDGGRADMDDDEDDDGDDSDDETAGDDTSGKKKSKSKGRRLNTEEAAEFSEWLKTTLDESLSQVTASNRLVDSPAVLVDHESAAIMRMMRLADQEHKTGGVKTFTPKQKMEFNPGHPIIAHLHEARNKDPELARVVAEQLYDNAVVAAGIMEDPRVMLSRLNDLLLRAMKKDE